MSNKSSTNGGPVIGHVHSAGEPWRDRREERLNPPLAETRGECPAETSRPNVFVNVRPVDINAGRYCSTCGADRLQGPCGHRPGIADEAERLLLAMVQFHEATTVIDCDPAFQPPAMARAYLVARGLLTEESE